MNSEVVLLHDWLTGFRGGERILEAFCEMFPAAPLHTLLYQKGRCSRLIEDRPIKTSFLDRLPGIHKNYRKFLPIMPLAADLMKIDESPRLVLSSSHCVIKGVTKPKGAVHISYVHSPMRYMYDQFDHYFGPSAPRLQRWGARVCRPYLVGWDRRSNLQVDVMVANSKFVQGRIRRYYERDAEVIHPFVELRDFEHLRIESNRPQRQEHFVMVTAFAPNKRVDLAVQAFNELKIPLRIVGSGQQEVELKKMALPHVTFLGSVGRSEVIRELAQAQGLIFPGVEDFGIVPLESLAAGTPVVALKAGGVLETLTEEDTEFFDELSVESLKAAVQRLTKTPRQPRWERLAAFSRERFFREIKELVASKVNGLF